MCVEGIKCNNDHNSDGYCGWDCADRGGYVVCYIGFAIFKCMRKKKGVSRLLEDDDM